MGGGGAEHLGCIHQPRLWSSCLLYIVMALVSWSGSLHRPSDPTSAQPWEDRTLTFRVLNGYIQGTKAGPGMVTAQYLAKWRV